MIEEATNTARGINPVSSFEPSEQQHGHTEAHRKQRVCSTTRWVLSQTRSSQLCFMASSRAARQSKPITAWLLPLEARPSRRSRLMRNRTLSSHDTISNKQTRTYTQKKNCANCEMNASALHQSKNWRKRAGSGHPCLPEFCDGFAWEWSSAFQQLLCGPEFWLCGSDSERMRNMSTCKEICRGA